MPLKPAYKRVLLKLSGEALMGDQKFGVEKRACEQISLAIKEVCSHGVQVGIVIGGGNIFRGAQAEAFDFARTPADQIGMLATTINGLVLQQSLATAGVESQVMSALSINTVVEPFVWNHAMQALNKGQTLIFVGGTGHPYFTTDTAAALRASEIGAEIVLKATKVNGIYDADPMTHPKATKFSRLTYSEVLSKNLKVMDLTAIALCRENQIPICVFNLFEKGALFKAVCGQHVGSLVKGD